MTNTERDRVRPFKHQQQLVDATKNDPYFAIFWEMGCAKTRPTLESALYQYEQGNIDAMLVVAPNGVHRNWVTDEAPLWLPEASAHFWHVGKSRTQRHKAEFEAAIKEDFPLVAMSPSGFITDLGRKYMRRYLGRRRVFYVLDESTLVKTPKARRTKAIVASGKYAPYRRILTGTPVTKSPFDLYKQIEFLDHTFWHRHGFKDFAAFKNYFGIFESHKQEVTLKSGATKEITYTYVVAYRNLDKLAAMIDPISSRLLKKDVLDLPPKLYSKRYFDPSPEQARIYREVWEEAIAFLESGDIITISQKITRMLRCAQVMSNYLPNDAGINVPIDSKKHPRLQCLMDTLAEIFHPTIIWARFREDIDAIMDKLGDTAVRYDGTVSDDDRARAKAAFQNGDAQFFVGNPKAGGKGLTLVQAQTVIYYNNDFDWEDRIQSEDRAHRPGQVHPVNYIDIVAPNSIDTYILRNLRKKLDISDAITGDNPREWI